MDLIVTVPEFTYLHHLKDFTETRFPFRIASKELTKNMYAFLSGALVQM